MNIIDGTGNHFISVWAAQYDAQYVHDFMVDYWSDFFGKSKCVDSGISTQTVGRYEFKTYTLNFVTSGVEGEADGTEISVVYYMYEKADATHIANYVQYTNDCAWENQVMDDILWSFEVQ